MTDQDTGDASQVDPLFDQIEVAIGQLTANGAYDGKPTYDAVIKHSASAMVVIPPRHRRGKTGHRSPSQRDRHVAAINPDGRMK